MSRKAKTKGRAAVKLKGKLRTKKAARNKPAKSRKAPAATTAAKTKSAGRKIVRIMGQGQFTVDAKTLKKLGDIDSAIVELVSTERSDDFEFRKKLVELNDTVVKHGKPVDSREIIKSDIILPSPDLSIDEAKRLFRGEGVIPAV
jgi:hypothetical protein